MYGLSAKKSGHWGEMAVSGGSTVILICKLCDLKNETLS